MDNLEATFNAVDEFFAALERNVARIEKLAALPESELRAEFPQFAARVDQIAARSIGKPFRVRLDRKTVRGGTIAEARAELRVTGTALRAYFHVVMVSGEKQVRREVCVTRLPR